MALSLDFHGFDDAGVKIIPPTAPEFDDLARPLIGERVAGTVFGLKPMLFIVTNESSRTVVSYSKVWHISYAGGRSHHIRSHTSFPEVVCGDTLLTQERDRHALRQGDKWIEACSIVIHGAGLLDPYYDQFLDQFVAEKNAMLENAVSLRTGLDAVIFADGAMIGLDEDAWLSGMFCRRIAAAQDWYRDVLATLDSGKSVEDAFRPVQAFVADAAAKMRANPHEYHLAMNDAAAFARHDAAGSVAGWRRRFSDDEIPGLLRSAIRLEPFVVRRG